MAVPPSPPIDRYETVVGTRDTRMFMAASNGPGDRLAIFIEVLQWGLPPNRAAAVERIGYSLSYGSDTEMRRGKSVLLTQCEKEGNPHVRETILRNLLGPLFWDLHYGSPEERATAVEYLGRLFRKVPIELFKLIYQELSRRQEVEHREEVKTRLAEVLQQDLDFLPLEIEVGLQIRQLRGEMGLSKAALAAKVGIAQKTLAELEGGIQRRPDLNTIYLLCGKLKQLPKRYKLYLLHNRELSGLDFFDRKTGSCIVETPQGLPPDYVIKRSTAVFVWRRLAQLDLNMTELASRSNLSQVFLIDILYGNSHHVTFDVVRRMAAVLQVPPSWLYLLFRKEIADFLPVVDRKTDALVSEPSGNLNFKRLKKNLGPYPSSEEEATLLRLHELSPGKGVREVVWRLFQVDPATKEPFIPLPAGWTQSAVDNLDLRQDLGLISGDFPTQEFLETMEIPRDAFYGLVSGRAFVTWRTLVRISEVFSVPVEVLTARYWPKRLPKPFSVRESPEQLPA